MKKAGSLDVQINQLLVQFLLTTNHLGLTIGSRKVAQVGQTQFAGLKLSTFSAVERSITGSTHFLVIRLSQNFIGNNQRTGKYIHTRDVSNKDIFQIGRVSAGFGIEVNTSCFEATSFQNHQHSLYSLIDIDGELVGIPTILVITAVGIDRAKQSRSEEHTSELQSRP